MAEGIDKGGLDYAINVIGDFETKFALFKSQLQEIKTLTKQGAVTDVAKTSGKAVTNAKAEATAKEKVTAALNKQSAVERKILRLQDRQLIAKSKQVTAEKVITDKVEQRQKADVIGLKIQKAETKQTIALAKAEERIARTSLKRLEIEKAIQLARKQGAITPAQISQATGISPTELGKRDKAIASQNKLLKDQEITRKRNLKIQERQTIQAEKNKKLHADILRTAKRFNISQQKAAKTLGVSATKARELGIELEKAKGFADNFLFTFRRLVGILAIFTLARKFATSIGDAVKEMSRFNSVLEQSKISLASLLASTGQMVDAEGNLVTGAEKYVASLGIAEDLQKQIRIDALGTVATYEELLGAVQAGLGPGIIAGLDVDEIRKASVAIAKAASTLNVSGAGFAEEIRSIILGVGTRRTTKLLQVIGLSKENIAQAKEAGTVFETIQVALESFNVATEDVRKSWKGLQSQIKDATSSLLQSGSVEYFETLKAAMAEFLKSLEAVDELTGKGVGINTDAVNAVSELSSGLKDIVLDFKVLTSFDEFFKSFSTNLAFIGEALRLVGDLVTPIIVGFGRGVTLVLGILAGIVKMVRSLGKVIPFIGAIVNGFKQTVAFVSAIAGAIATWVVLTKVYNTVIAVSRTIMASMVLIQKTILTLQFLWTVAVTAHNAGLSITAALMTVITGGLNLIVIAVVAIATLIGAVLHSTGALSKLFIKINKTLGISKDKVSDIKDDILAGTNALFGQSEAANKLEASFKSLEVQLIKMQNQTKSLLLTSAIRGEARQLFVGVSEGLRKFGNEVIDIDKQIDLNRAKTAAAAKERNLDAIQQAKDLASATEAQIGVFTIADPSSIEDASEAFLAISDEQLEKSKEILKQEAAYQGLLIQGEELLDARKDLLAAHVDLIEEGVRQENIRLQRELKNNDAVSARFELRKALTLEELRKAKDSLRALELQRIEIEKQEAVRENNIRLDRESLDAIDKQIALAEKAGADQKALNTLIENRNKIEQRNIAIRAREAVLIRTMKADLQDMADIVVTNDWLVAMSNGFKRGAEEFISSADTLAEGFADAMQSALEDAVSAASDAIVDIIDPRTEAPSAQEVAGEVLLGLAENLINVILNQFLQNLLTTFLGVEATEQLQIAALEANTAAILASTESRLIGLPENIVEGDVADIGVGLSEEDENTKQAVSEGVTGAFEGIFQTLGGLFNGVTAALFGNTAATTANSAVETANTAATTTNVAATTANTGGIISNTAATIANTVRAIAAFIANTAATVLNTLWLAINAAIPGAKGGMVTRRGFASNLTKGGWINPLSVVPQYTHAQGFAMGGDVRRHPRPAHISPKDTVAAWLQPGEFVVRESRVKQFGARFFDMLNRGIINPEMAQAHVTSKISRTRGVFGLADGGMVGGSSSAVSRSRTRSDNDGGGGTSTIVLPVIAADNNTMDQMIAGGRDVFESEVNDTPDFSNPNESNN